MISFHSLIHDVVLSSRGPILWSHRSLIHTHILAPEYCPLDSIAGPRGLAVVVSSGGCLGLGEVARAGLEVHPVGGDGLVEGLPGLGLPGDDAKDVHGVDLLEGAALGLVDEEEGDEDTEEAAAGEDVTVAVADGGGDPGGEEGDEEVPQPVGGSAERHGDGTVAGREHFTDDGPDKRSPLFECRLAEPISRECFMGYVETYGNSEADNEETGGGNHSRANGGVGTGVGVVGVAIGVQGERAQGGEDDEPQEHPDTADDHGDTATELLADVQTTEGGEDVDGTEDHGGDVRVGDTDGGKDLSSVVEEEVGTGKLLQGLKGHADEDTTEHSRGSEDLEPLGLATGNLSLVLLANLGQLVLDLRVVGLDAGDKSQGLGGLGLSTTAVLPAGRLTHGQHAGAHNRGGDETNAHGDAPRALGLDGLGTVVDTVGDKDTEGDEQLVGGDEGTTGLARRGLGLVHGRQDGEGTDAETVNKTANDDLVPLVGGGNAHDVADDVDDAPEGDGELAAELVGDGSRDESANQATSAKHGDHQTLSNITETQDAVLLGVAKVFPEVCHLCVTGDGTTFPSEDETTERDEQAHDDDPEVEDLDGRVVAGIVAGGGLLLVAIWWC